MEAVIPLPSAQVTKLFASVPVLEHAPKNSSPLKEWLGVFSHNSVFDH